MCRSELNHLIWSKNIGVKGRKLESFQIWLTALHHCLATVEHLLSRISFAKLSVFQKTVLRCHDGPRWQQRPKNIWLGLFFIQENTVQVVTMGMVLDFIRGNKIIATIHDKNKAT